MNDHIGKPVVPEKLYETLLKWLPEAPADQAPASIVAAPGGDAMATPRTRFAAIAGLDLDIGLRSVRGRNASLARLLKMFAEDHRHDTSRMRTLLAGGALDELEQMTHTIKGVATTLGAHGIAKAARQLEQAVREQQSPEHLDVFIAILDTRLTRLFADIANAMANANDTTDDSPGGSSDVGGEPLPAADPAAVIAYLEELLATDDARSNDFIAESWPQVESALGDVASNLRDQVEHFDYEEALQTLHRARFAAQADPAGNDDRA